MWDMSSAETSLKEKQILFYLQRPPERRSERLLKFAFSYGTYRDLHNTYMIRGPIILRIIFEIT